MWRVRETARRTEETGIEETTITRSQICRRGTIIVKIEIKTQFELCTLNKIVGRTRVQDHIREPIRIKMGISTTHVAHTKD